MTKFDHRTLTYSVAVDPTPSSKYTTGYLANILTPITYPSGAHEDFLFQSTDTLTNPIDIPFAAPERAPTSVHSYGAMTVRKKGIDRIFSMDYLAVADASLTTKKWIYVSPKPYGPTLAGSGLYNVEAQQGTKSYYDSVTDRRYVTLAPGDAGINARSHIIEINPDTHIPTAAYYIPWLGNRTSLVAVDRWLYIFNPRVTNGIETVSS